MAAQRALQECNRHSNVGHIERLLTPVTKSKSTVTISIEEVSSRNSRKACRHCMAKHLGKE